MKREKIYTIGVMNWTELRAFIIEHLESCRTELEFSEVMFRLWKSVGTPEHLAKVRKELGLPYKSIKTEIKEKLKEMKK
jgi:hypothetical protein